MNAQPVPPAAEGEPGTMICAFCWPAWVPATHWKRVEGETNHFLPSCWRCHTTNGAPTLPRFIWRDMVREVLDPMARQAHFEVYEDEGGGWRWRLVAANGRIVADSAEAYTRATDAERACAGVTLTVARIDHQQTLDRIREAGSDGVRGLQAETGADSANDGGRA